MNLDEVYIIITEYEVSLTWYSVLAILSVQKFIILSMNYYTSLVKTIDKLKAEGKEVKLTQLPSVVNINRKSIKF